MTRTARDRRSVVLMSLLALLAALAAVAAVGAARNTVGLGYVSWSPLGVALLLVPGFAAVAVALDSFRRHGAERAPVLLALAGVGSFLPGLGIAGVRPSLIFTVGLVLGWAMPALVGQLALIYPDARPDRRVSAMILTGYAVTIGALGLLTALVFDPVDAGCGQCATNLVLMRGSSRLVTPFGQAGIAAALAWVIATVAVLVARISLASPARRRIVAPVVLPAVVLVGAFAAELALSLDRGYLATDTPGRKLWLVGQLALLAVALGLASRWLRTRRARVRLARDVVELARHAESDTVAARLGRAFGDPTLEIGYAVGVAGELVDAAGNPLPPRGDHVTTLPRAGGRDPVAVLRHRPGLLDDPALVDEVGRAAGLALANERLRAQARARLIELQASRTRIVEAADAERRRLERNVHDGAQQRLVSLAVALRAARGTDGNAPLVDEAQAELAAALDELRTIARGIYPAALADSGLAAAIHTLAETGTIPLTIGALPARRFDPAVEAAAYFVVADAMRDPAARRVAVGVEAVDATFLLSVTTDAPATELTRLSDRVGAAGGAILRKPLPDGRVGLEVSIPCGS